MGVWGTGISSNDTFGDVYDSFFDLYDDGLSVKEISEHLIKENQDTISNPDDSGNFWFALAKAQWTCKALDPEIFNRVKQIIESGQDLASWKSLDAGESDLKKRKVVLDNFLKTISLVKRNARPRKKKVFYKPEYQKGDCLSFQYENSKYAGLWSLAPLVRID